MHSIRSLLDITLYGDVFLLPSSCGPEVVSKKTLPCESRDLGSNHSLGQRTLGIWNSPLFLARSKFLHKPWLLSLV